MKKLMFLTFVTLGLLAITYFEWTKVPAIDQVDLTVVTGNSLEVGDIRPFQLRVNNESSEEIRVLNLTHC